MNIFFQVIWTVIGAFLSVILTKFLIQNGRAIKEGFAKMDERTMEIAKLIEKISQQIEKIPDKTAYLLK